MKETTLLVMQLLTSAMLAILFLQSGLDKVMNWSGNLEWLKGHFSKSVLKDVVPLLLAVITLAEIAAGTLCGVGIITLFFGKDPSLAFYGAVVSGLCIVMLFFGQRLAQDYAGAASLIPYFILCVLGIYLLGS
jgi:uncharacterized membrane protein YphA (DoxX/SURF4 family)